MELAWGFMRLRLDPPICVITLKMAFLKNLQSSSAAILSSVRRTPVCTHSYEYEDVCCLYESPSHPPSSISVNPKLFFQLDPGMLLPLCPSPGLVTGMHSHTWLLTWMLSSELMSSGLHLKSFYPMSHLPSPKTEVWAVMVAWHLPERTVVSWCSV